MSYSRFASIASCAVLACTLAVVTGCNDNNKDNRSDGKGAALTPKKLNEVTSDSKLRDAEEAEKRGDYARAQYDLASAGGGVRLNYNSRAAVSLEFAHPIERPYAGYRERWQVSIGWTVSLVR